MSEPLNFATAYAEYIRLRAASDALSDDSPNADTAIEAYCAAMDVVIEDVRAPSLAALLIKLDLIQERQTDFGLIESFFEATKRDVAALAAEEA